MDWNHSWLRKHTLKHLILSPLTFETDQNALSITFKQQETGKGRGKGKEGDRGWETQSEGDSRDWMIRFQLWAAAVEDSVG